MRFAAVLALFLSLAAFSLADGAYIPSPVSGNVFETHQLLVANLTENSVDARVFISIEGNANADLVYFFPFKDKPAFFDFGETQASDFRKNYGLAQADDALKQKQKYRALADGVDGTLLWSAGLTAFAPLAPLALLTLVGGIGGIGAVGSQSFGAGSKGLEETRVFSRGTLEVYNVSEANIDYIITKYGADASLKERFKEYGQMHLYVFTIRPYESGLSSVFDLCYDSKAALKLLAQDKITSSEWNRACGPAIPFEGYGMLGNYYAPGNYDSDSRVPEGVVPTLNQLKSLVEGAKGLELHYVQDLPDGKFWYPLGTGQFWDNPIGLTALYVFTPQSHSLSSSLDFERVSYAGKTAYVRKITAENPDYDVVMSASESGLAGAGDAMRAGLGGLLEFLAALAFLVPLAGALAGGARVLQKEKAAKPWMKSALLLAVWLFTWAAGLAAAVFVGGLFSLAIVVVGMNSQGIALALGIVAVLAALGAFLAVCYFSFAYLPKRIAGKTTLQFASFGLAAFAFHAFLAAGIFFVLYHALVMLYYAV